MGAATGNRYLLMSAEIVGESTASLRRHLLLNETGGKPHKTLEGYLMMYHITESCTCTIPLITSLHILATCVKINCDFYKILVVLGSGKLIVVCLFVRLFVCSFVTFFVFDLIDIGIHG